MNTQDKLLEIIDEMSRIDAKFSSIMFNFKHIIKYDKDDIINFVSNFICDKCYYRKLTNFEQIYLLSERMFVSDKMPNLERLSRYSYSFSLTLLTIDEESYICINIIYNSIRMEFLKKCYNNINDVYKILEELYPEPFIMLKFID
jgi:hypothetical protein